MCIFKKKKSKVLKGEEFNSYVRYLANGLKAWSHHFECALGHAEAEKKPEIEKFISDYNELVNRLYEMSKDS